MEYVRAIEVKHASCKKKNVLCFMDDLKTYLEQPPDETIQSQYCDGWTWGHYIMNVFVFNLDGTIPMTYFEDILGQDSYWVGDNFQYM